MLEKLSNYLAYKMATKLIFKSYLLLCLCVWHVSNFKECVSWENDDVDGLIQEMLLICKFVEGEIWSITEEP